MDLPSEDTLRWIVRTYGRLRARYGEAIGAPALLQPSGDFFPDEFHLDPDSVTRLLRRIIGYSPVADDLGIELSFVEPSADHAGGCGSSACGPPGTAGALPPVQELADGYRVFVSVKDVPNPDLLTTSLARSVGALVLLEAGEALEAGDDEIAGVACGFGVLLARGASVWAKGCGGLRMSQATALSVEEITVALALFAAVHHIRPSETRAHLGTTQREAFELAVDWVDSNPMLVETLRDRPALLETGHFALEPVRGLLGRWLHKRRLDKDLRVPLTASEKPLSDDKRRRMEEARALVDEVLGGE